MTKDDTKQKIQPLIEKIMAANAAKGPHGGGGMLKEEYEYISDLVLRRSPCNILIFGTGNDSELWILANQDGRTVFLENQQRWIDVAKGNFPNIEFYHITYLKKEAQLSLLELYKHGQPGIALPMPEEIANVAWDIIIVDGPAGPRMQSIGTSSELARNSANVDVIFHDASREKPYIDQFYSEAELLRPYKRMKHYRVNTTSLSSQS